MVCRPLPSARTLADLWSTRYRELYEDGDGGSLLPLSEAEGRVLDALTSEGGPVAHERLVYMAWALALAAEPTVLRHSPDEGRPARVLRRVEEQLRRSLLEAAPDLVTAFPSTVVVPQALHESLDTFRSLARALDLIEAREAVESALDDCLEGYAVFPGADGRRDLFNWWLTRVAPAAHSRRLPEEIYTMLWPWPPPRRAGDGT